MHKILVLGASNSKNSINKKFAYYTSSLLNNVSITKIDLNDFDMPIFGVDLETEIGVPDKAKAFASLIDEHDGLLIALAEHNSNFSVAFKNIMDWVSRLEGKVWKNKKMLLLSTSPGGRGGASVMEIAVKIFPFSGADIIAYFSLPNFSKNFDEHKGISDEALNQKYLDAIQQFEMSL